MKVIAVNGKILLANGKAVKPPAVAAGSELVLSATRLPAVTFCTDVIENHIVSVATFAPGGIVEDTTPPPAPKYSYNGVVLPEIPVDVLAEYPYAWIRNNDRTGYYDLCLSSSLWYASDAVTISTDSYNTTGIQWYRITKNTPEEAWVFNQAWTSSGGFGNESDRHIMWSNHDIPNGSATATEIYFEGSEPVLAE